MIKRSFIKYFAASIAGGLLVSCGDKTTTEYHEKNRDNVIDGLSLMVSIDDNLPSIHSFAVPIMAGDTLVIIDFRSTDLLYTAYDIYNDTTLGRFGKYGNGPGEVANPLFSFYDSYSRNIYVGNGNQGKLSYFHLPEAVSDSTYDAIDKTTVDVYRGILYPYVVDESTVLCTTYPDLSNRNSRISKLNLDTGEITVIDSVTPGDNVRTAIAVSSKDNLIFAADKRHDLIRILDLDGNEHKKIFGPEYDDNIKDDEHFFSESVICGKTVASLYTGKNNSEKYDNRIILTELAGKYLKTIQFEETIHGMQYHDKTGRLYLTTR